MQTVSNAVKDLDCNVCALQIGVGASPPRRKGTCGSRGAG
jgi:hypothetical protein